MPCIFFIIMMMMKIFKYYLLILLIKFTESIVNILHVYTHPEQLDPDFKRSKLN